jgi:isoaspartyl peptidase/L-asparaginase-like protein (Ntn-hydrolase superfamily)
VSGAIGFALHGGAGVLDPRHFPEARRRECAEALGAIARRAVDALRAGASALDVVEQAVVDLEEAPFFNAGHGAVLNANGEVELDAAIMDGRDRAAGAVAGVTRARNPIRLARAVMARSEHVMLIGEGADAFAAECGLEIVDPAWFIRDERRVQLANARAEGRITLDHDERYESVERVSGTVGAVALDRDGHLAAATSTGGMTNKRPGRVGDAPLIGCGTFADDASCAVSATGHGEYYIRRVLAHDVAARIAYRGEGLIEATEGALAEVGAMGGAGGLIAVDRAGRVALPFNSPGMYRAWLDPETGRVAVGIYREPEV